MAIPANTTAWVWVHHVQAVSKDVLPIVAGRVVPAAFFLTVALAKVRALGELIHSTSQLPNGLERLGFFAGCTYKLVSIIFFLLIAIFFAIRLCPIRSSPSVGQTVVALAGTYCMMLVSLAPSANMPAAVTIVAAAMMIAGTLFSAAALVYLGRSLSISPEARRLVTGGLYSIVRHPMYLGEMLASMGMVIQAPSYISALIFIVFCFLQIKRMDYEEHVLQQVFPEYQLYLAKTARLIPGIY